MLSSILGEIGCVEWDGIRCRSSHVVCPRLRSNIDWFIAIKTQICQRAVAQWLKRRVNKRLWAPSGCFISAVSFFCSTSKAHAHMWVGNCFQSSPSLMNASSITLTSLPLFKWTFLVCWNFYFIYSFDKVQMKYNPRHSRLRSNNLKQCFTFQVFSLSVCRSYLTKIYNFCFTIAEC